MSSKNQHYLALDAARGLAAIAVMIYHTEQLFSLKLFTGSFLAVDLFFLMSGYVVARAYEEKLRSGALDFWAFLRIRALRLLPLYYAAITLGFLYFLAKVILQQDDATPLSVLLTLVPQAILLLPVLGSGLGLGMFPFAPSAWSLSLEFWFNLLYAVLLPILTERVLVAIAIISLGIFAAESVRIGSTDLGWGAANLFGGIARFCFSFALGAMMFRRQISISLPMPVFAGIFLLAFGFMFLPGKAVFIHFIWIILLFPLFLATAIPVALTGLSAWISDHLGRLSYGIYILHIPVLLLAQGAYKAAFGIEAGSAGLAVGTFAIVSIIGVTALLTYGFDEPLRRALRRPTSRKSVRDT